MTDKKIKILTISDHPLSPSGVGTQTKYMIEALLETKKYQVISLGGAVKHQDYTPIKVGDYGEDWMIIPIDGYGNQENIRSILRTQKPDILWFMTDPRFYEWLWQIDNEIRAHVPMVYYHVWDNHPAPVFNKLFYDSNDLIASISKVTHDVVSEVTSDVENVYLPHAVDDQFFKPFPQEEINNLKISQGLENKFIFFWNNRNARRKMSGSLIYWFKKFCDKVGHDKAVLIMHTDSNDPYGQPLDHLLHHFGVNKGQILISRDKISPEQLAKMYNVSDCTINISDAEGFGLATLESLSCGTPIIVTMTGGLQEQVTDGEKWFGIGIEPSSKALIGSQQVPYIFEDRVSEEDVVDAMTKMYEMDKEERKSLGDAGRQHVLENYSFEDYKKQWVELMEDVHDRHGSWETRKNYSPWTLKKII
jgi:glycosyltransferase involved in cell wall biosynthesis|tara:strand:- start:2201 stop:3457 length:1257 start_codon:yes stop_codon:yes gene_type:complete